MNKYIAALTIMLCLWVATETKPVLANDAEDFLVILNEYRVNNGKQPVCLNNLLNEAAHRHSTDMYENDMFDHTGSDGSRFWQRIEDTGYTGSARAENVAWGYTNVTSLFNGWEGSFSHRNNMLSDSNEIGISRVGNYWTLDLAKRNGACEPTPSLAELDVNNDGIITPVDALYVTNRLGTNNASADVNNDGSVTQADAQFVFDNLGVTIP